MYALIAIGTLSSTTNAQAVNKSTLDSYSMLIVSKHLKSEQDYKNLTMVCKKFKKNNKKFRYNPISITDKTKIFPNIQTHVLYSQDDKDISDEFNTVVHLEPIFMSDITNKKNHYYKNIILDRKFILKSLFVENNGVVIIDGTQKFSNISRSIFDPVVTKLVIGADIISPTYAVGNNIREIHADACIGLNNIKSIEIKPSIKKIGALAFSNCNLNKLNLSNGLMEIDEAAFAYCENLTKVILPDTLDKIAASAFHKCQNLMSISFGSSLKRIPNHMLSGFTNLTELVIHNGVEQIGTSAVECCNSLAEISIPASITAIEYQVFNSCTKLTKLSYDNCYAIDFFPTTFNNCNNLRKLVTPKGWSLFIYELQYEDKILLSDSIRIQVIGVVEKHSIDDIEIINDKRTSGHRINNQSDVLNALNGVKIIDKYAFSQCNILRDISLPDSIEEIRYSAFERCKNLQSISLGHNVTKIEYSLFEWCTQLSKVCLPNSISALARNTFYYCQNLADVNMPSQLTYIGIGCFGKCSKLKEIIIPNSVTSIEASAFSNCSALTYVKLPYAITCISDFTFSECKALKSIEIPANVMNVDYGAFYNCSNLTKIIAIKKAGEDNYRVSNMFNTSNEFSDINLKLIELREQDSLE